MVMAGWTNLLKNPDITAQLAGNTACHNYIIEFERVQCTALPSLSLSSFFFRFAFPLLPFSLKLPVFFLHPKLSLFLFLSLFVSISGISLLTVTNNVYEAMTSAFTEPLNSVSLSKIFLSNRISVIRFTSTRALEPSGPPAARARSSSFKITFLTT